MIKNQIKKIIKKAVIEKFGKIKIPEIKIEKPENKKFGDYSSNIALQLSKVLKKKPIEIAKRLNLMFQIKDSRLFDEVKIANPGFLNFYLNKEYLQNQILEILKKCEKFGDLDIGKNKKLQVEFISANPTGPLTVGNARGGPFGDVLANVLKKAGYKVEKAYYINDYGNQILALGHSVLKDKSAKYKGKYIDDLRKKIKDKNPQKVGQKAAKIIIKEIIKKTTKKMGIRLDEWFLESRLYNSGEVDRVLKLLKKKKLIYKKDGAEFFKSLKFGDQRDRVLVKKDGTKTYLAGDIAYHKYKFENKKFDKVINVWGADHSGDVPGLQAGVSALGHKGKLDIILLQFVTLLHGKKMSKRKGIYVTMDELLDEVGKDVTRFFFLQKSADNHLTFDMALAKEQSKKNPVYYIQYAYTRIHSILNKAPNPNAQYLIKSKIPMTKLEAPSELALIKQLIRLPEVVEDTAKDYQIQRLPNYAMELVAAFHKFYEECRVISNDKEKTQARLNLVMATKIVLKNILYLMGISAPEKM